MEEDNIGEDIKFSVTSTPKNESHIKDKPVNGSVQNSVKHKFKLSTPKFIPREKPLIPFFPNPPSPLTNFAPLYNQVSSSKTTGQEEANY